MISLHTGRKISAATLVESGAIIKPPQHFLNGTVCVEFPASAEVGPISSSWEIEVSDEEFLKALWADLPITMSNKVHALLKKDAVKVFEIHSPLVAPRKQRPPKKMTQAEHDLQSQKNSAAIQGFYHIPPSTTSTFSIVDEVNDFNVHVYNSEYPRWPCFSVQRGTHFNTSEEHELIQARFLQNKAAYAWFSSRNHGETLAYYEACIAAIKVAMNS